MEYEVDPAKWNSKKGELDFEDIHHFTTIHFKEFLMKKYLELKNEGKDEVLVRLKNEALTFTQEAGIEGIAEKMFDLLNDGKALPEYKYFIQAFEKFSNLKKGEYKVETIDNMIRFHTNDNKVFEMDTYEGLKSRLQSIIDERCYDDICVLTDENIWGDIYTDGGIKKSEFLPVMLNEWRVFWNKQYQDFREKTGKTDHLNMLNQESWRNFQVFMACYDDAHDVINLAFNIDDLELYPIAVLTMLQIFKAEVCYSEYCDFEFDGKNEWKDVSLTDNEDDTDNEDEVYEDSPTFFIRELEDFF
jgi:hypothetical protein